MSSLTTEIRWSISQQAQSLAVEVSLRRAPAFEEEVLASRVIDVHELDDRFPDHRRSTALLTTWLTAEPAWWTAEGPQRADDPADGWTDEALVAGWGQFLGRLLVTEVVGERLDALVGAARESVDRPLIRLLFAPRGAVARRLPFELMQWPGGLAEPVCQHRGLSVLREAEAARGAPVLRPMPELRIVVAGVVAPGELDAAEWARLSEGLWGEGPQDFRGCVGPGRSDDPAQALRTLAGRTGDIAVVWGHGVRQAGAAPVWPGGAGGAAATAVVDALGDRYGTVLLAMCFSSSEGVMGERSVTSRLVSDGGVGFALGFQGRPASAAVTDVVHRFVRTLRATDQRDGPDAFAARELALYLVRTQASDVHGVARQVIAEVSPHLTTGRRRPPAFFRSAARTPVRAQLQAYRTAGQVLITEVDDHGLVRIPLPVDPVTFEIELAGATMRIDHVVPGLTLDLQRRVLGMWPELELTAVDRTDAAGLDRCWGLHSAMLESIVTALECLTDQHRPPEVAKLVADARARDWGSPPSMAIVEVQTGFVVCELGPPLPGAAAEHLATAAGDAIDITYLAAEVRAHGLLVEPRGGVDWGVVDRAAAGDDASLGHLVEACQARLTSALATRPGLGNIGILPDRCLGLPVLTRLVGPVAS
jgi:hypothetical protein